MILGRERILRFAKLANLLTWLSRFGQKLGQTPISEVFVKKYANHLALNRNTDSLKPASRYSIDAFCRLR